MKRAGKMYATGNTVISKFKNSSEACRIYLFKMYCCTIYGCALWANYDISSYQRMKVAHNDIFRTLLKERRGPNHSVSRLFVQKNVNNLESLVRISVHSLMRRIMASTNQLVAALRDGSARVHSRLWHQWGLVLRQDARQELLFIPYE